MNKQRSELWRVMRLFAVELAVYAVLMTVYFLLALRFLAEPLTRLFNSEKHLLYGLASLGLIVAQGTLLESLTSFLLRLAGLEGHGGGSEH